MYTHLLLTLILLLPVTASAWIINSDFEQGTVGEKAKGPSGFGGAKGLTVFTREKSLSGSQSAKATITEGNDGWRQWGGQTIFPTPLKVGDEIWYRVFIYYPQDWIFGNGPKGLRIHLADNAGGNIGYFDYFILGNQLNLASEIGSSLDVVGGGPCPYGSNPNWKQFRCNMEKLGNPQKNLINVTKGTWHAFEMYVKLHHEPGKAMYRAWYDGQLIFEDPLTATMKSPTDQADFIYLFTTWNGGAPATQSNYIDDLLITNEIPSNRDSKGNPFIGTGGVTFKARPNPPQILQ